MSLLSLWLCKRVVDLYTLVLGCDDVTVSCVTSVYMSTGHCSHTRDTRHTRRSPHTGHRSTPTLCVCGTWRGELEAPTADRGARTGQLSPKAKR